MYVCLYVKAHGEQHQTPKFETLESGRQVAWQRCIYIYIYIYSYTHTYTHIYALYTHIHTHIRTVICLQKPSETSTKSASTRR